MKKGYKKPRLKKAGDLKSVTGVSPRNLMKLGMS